MVIFHSYVKLPEGIINGFYQLHSWIWATLLSPGKAITRLQWAAAFGITWGSQLPRCVHQVSHVLCCDDTIHFFLFSCRSIVQYLMNPPCYNFLNPLKNIVWFEWCYHNSNVACSLSWGWEQLASPWEAKKEAISRPLPWLLRIEDIDVIALVI